MLHIQWAYGMTTKAETSVVLSWNSISSENKDDDAPEYIVIAGALLTPPSVNAADNLGKICSRLCTFCV